MDAHDLASLKPLEDHRGARQHRFMESADINAAFREFFGPLRANIRRGLSSEGQLFAVEMDACIPGEVLGATWIPPATRGIADNAQLEQPACRRRVFDSLLQETREDTLFAYVNERHGHGAPHLYLELASADGLFAAEYPIGPGEGFHHRELLHAEHRRLSLRTTA